MASAEKEQQELEEQLLEAGNKLLDPPSSVDELLLLLDLVESCLSRVEQSPTKSMQDALSPSLKALIADTLLRHADVDVKVAVASCISEVTRITAPEAPYDDDQMKEVFRLIVSSFENLHDKLSRSYTKRTSILETVSKVRSCVVMLDLECDDLILEMFQHFLKAIGDHHPESVFSSMETIMILVLEESEDISLDLLSPILASVKKDNEEVLPIARRLGESVLESCATRLRPYLKQAVSTLGISLDDYSNVLASICQDTSGSLEQNDACVTSDHVEDGIKLGKEPADESAQVDGENSKEAAPPQQDNSVGDRSPKSVMSNGIAQAGEDDAVVDPKSIKKHDDTDCPVQSEGINLSGHEEPNDLDTEKVDNNDEKVDNSEQKPEQSTKRRGRKPSSSKLLEPSEGSNLANEKEAEKIIDSESYRKEVPNSPHEDDCIEAAGPSENDKEIDAKISSPKAGDGESDAVASPSRSESIHDENRSKKRGRAKKKEILTKEVAKGADIASKKASEGISDSEAKLLRLSAKKGIGHASLKKTTAVDAVKKGSETTNDLDGKKHPAKKADERNKGGGGSSSRKLEDKKKKGRGKGNSGKGLAKSSAKDEDKEMVSSPKSVAKSTKDGHSEETPRTNLKRKRTPGKENMSNTKEYGEELVGKRVKVWWPEDQMFYEGVVSYFYPAPHNRHQIVYDDGDEEILILKEEIWELIETGDDSDGGEGTDRTSPVASADLPPKKKGKTSAGEFKKEGKRDSSSRSGGASSSKSKAVSVKSSKSKDGSKGSRKSKDSKAYVKSEDEVSRKSKDHSLKSSGSKSTDASHKSKSKNMDSSKLSKSKDDVSTPKTSAKSKQETPKTGKSKQEASKTASSSKAKSTKSGGKSNTNGTGKVKPNSLKTEDSDNEDSEDSMKEVEETKVKTSSSSKAGSEAKSGKKRGRT
ncbi:Sister chromatid cohesion protein PDS5-like B-B [Spatholobus suberectus]|nr:Sister chromatid cohesion protein PDS5-like B-B [Spatholobus suberectus]